MEFSLNQFSLFVCGHLNSSVHFIRWWMYNSTFRGENKWNKQNTIGGLSNKLNEMKKKAMTQHRVMRFVKKYTIAQWKQFNWIIKAMFNILGSLFLRLLFIWIVFNFHETFVVCLSSLWLTGQIPKTKRTKQCEPCSFLSSSNFSSCVCLYLVVL